MAETDTTIEAIDHPAPQRERVGLAALAFGLAAPPLAWAGQLVTNYAIASHVCFPGGQPLAGLAVEAHPAWLVLLIVELLALAIAVSAGGVAYASWRSTRKEAEGETSHMFEKGEGRTRFLALWGLITSVGFVIAIGFSLIGLFVVPLCGT